MSLITTELAPLELATGIVSGADEHSGIELVPGHHTPLAALAEILAEALEQPPCFVTFTGGRDSSAMLGLAAAVARRRGLPDPRPLTMVFPHVRSSDETSWQELMLSFLEIDRGCWERITIGPGELDLVGAEASAMLTRHGLLYPPNVLLALPVVKHVGTATVVSGIEGDGLLGGWRHAYFTDLVARRRPFEIMEFARHAYQFAPRAVRHRIVRERALPMPWLTREAYERFRDNWAQEKVTAPRRWDSWVAWWARRRYHRLLRSSFDEVGAAYGTRPIHPLMDGRFLSALATAGGAWGFGDRRQVMHAVFGSYLPRPVLDRQTKAATFTDLVWGPRSREFAAAWDGRGLDPTCVDAERLQEIWTGLSTTDAPDELTSLLLQYLWLHGTEG